MLLVRQVVGYLRNAAHRATKGGRGRRELTGAKKETAAVY